MKANPTKAITKATPFDLSPIAEATRSKTTSPEAANPAASLAVNTAADTMVKGVDTQENPFGSNPTTTSHGDNIGVVLAETMKENDAGGGDAETRKALAKALKGDGIEGNEAVADTSPLPEGVPDLPAAANVPVPAEVIESTLATESIMEKLGITDLSSLNYAQLKLLTAEAGKAAMERRQDELKTLLEGCIEKADGLGVTEADLIKRLKALYSHRGLQQGLGLSAGLSSANAVRNGQRPVVGVTYRHPVTGEEWTKTRAQGMAKKVFVDLIYSGYTWADLEVKG